MRQDLFSVYIFYEFFKGIEYFFDSLVIRDAVVGGIAVEGNAFVIEVVDFCLPSFSKGRVDTSTSLTISSGERSRKKTVPVFLKMSMFSERLTTPPPQATTMPDFSARDWLARTSASRKQSSLTAKSSGMVLPSCSTMTSSAS